jgi:hypothetical protein
MSYSFLQEEYEHCQHEHGSCVYNKIVASDCGKNLTHGVDVFDCAAVHTQCKPPADNAELKFVYSTLTLSLMFLINYYCHFFSFRYLILFFICRTLAGKCAADKQTLKSHWASAECTVQHKTAEVQCQDEKFKA